MESLCCGFVDKDIKLVEKPVDFNLLTKDDNTCQLMHSSQ